jgi:DNA repair protein RecN (Recombination protein N)
MLARLSIRDFVIVDALDLDFSSGFTVLTGETGAGKSILIDALALALGERAEAGVVRAGAERAEVIAEFELKRVAAAQQWLRDNELETEEGVCILRRTVDSASRSRAYINGRSSTAQQLKELGDSLVDIHGQHAHQSLLKRETQRTLLDDFGGHSDLAREVAARYRTWQRLRDTRLERERNAEAVQAERHQLIWEVRELTDLAFEPAAWQEVLAEHGRLSHAVALIEAAQAGVESLAEGEAAALSSLNAVLARLNSLKEYDPRLADVTDILDPARIQVQEAVYALRHYLQRLELDPARLDELERRVRSVHDAARKHRIHPDELDALLARKRARLEELGGVEADSELLARERQAEADYLAGATKLSNSRKETSQALGEQVTASMQRLAMVGGCFEVALSAVEPGGVFGLEQVEFLVSAHQGTPPAPLVKVASGGELSRVSLAIQVITSQVAATPTLIFDEVDAGIGGRVAEIVGQLLQQLGRARQVMCVTHLPQVAARADQHWRVSKGNVGGTVRSRIDVLDKGGRVEELARMLGGVKITDTTRKHAQEMLGGK